MTWVRAHWFLRRGGGALALLLVSLLTLEVALQVGALVVAWSESRAEPREHTVTGLSVLCIGDSFTYGMGATSPEWSYPLQLERILRRSGHPHAKVVNAGVPGRSSREVLETLPDLLQAHQPDVVYVLVGVNDVWVRPERLTVEPGAGGGPRGVMAGYRLEWRLGRLISLLRHRGEPIWVLASFDPRFVDEQGIARWKESVEAFLVDGDLARLRRDKNALLEEIGRSQVHNLLSAAQEMGLEGSDLVRVKKVVLEAGDEELSRITAVYGAHLREIVRTAERQGAQVVFLSYPSFEAPPMSAMRRRVAQEMDRTLVDLEAEFVQRVPAHTRADHFVADGHCSDLGYGVMAEVIAQDVLGRVTGSPRFQNSE